jgi:hypothetical protein
MLTDCAEL